jgi:hypothetical protein
MEPQKAQHTISLFLIILLFVLVHHYIALLAADQDIWRFGMSDLSAASWSEFTSLSWLLLTKFPPGVFPLPVLRYLFQSCLVMTTQ